MDFGTYQIDFDVSDRYNPLYNVPLVWTTQGHLFYPIDRKIYRFSPNGVHCEFIGNADATAMATGFFGPNRVESVVYVSHETELLSVRNTRTGKRLFRHNCRRSRKGSYTAVCWHAGNLSVGYDSGALQHFNVTGRKATSLLGKKEMKTKGVHECDITRIAWNTNGEFFASGDVRGNVAVWTAAGTLICVVLKPIVPYGFDRADSSTCSHCISHFAFG